MSRQWKKENLSRRMDRFEESMAAEKENMSKPRFEERLDGWEENISKRRR